MEAEIEDWLRERTWAKVSVHDQSQENVIEQLNAINDSTPAVMGPTGMGNRRLVKPILSRTLKLYRD
ncbi:MAG: hypothetical protein LQ352_001914 [Teloschistes flavicans]|nr:MAG: hypothetical protein LQ352_001914 [Teloschistes flavicans]